MAFCRFQPYRLRLLWVKSGLSKQIKCYHLSGWYWGKADTRHSEYRGIRVAAFGQNRPLQCFPGKFRSISTTNSSSSDPVDSNISIAS